MKIKNYSKNEWLSLSIDQRLKLLEEMDVITIRKKITLVDGKYSWYPDEKRIVDTETNEAVPLSVKEYEILECVIKKRLKEGSGAVSTYEEIFNYAWDKPATMYTMRNMVSSLRLKTDYSILKNISNTGYSMELSVGE